MQTIDESPVLACTLTEAEFRDRRMLLRATLRSHIERVVNKQRQVTFVFSHSVDVSRVEEFVGLEQQCCSFLSFEIKQSNGRVTLQITGPEGSDDVLQMFAQGAQEQQ